LHEDGLAVGGDLIITKGDYEEADPGLVAVQWFNVQNTGDATDIIRVGIESTYDYTLLNDLYAIGAGETVKVPVYIQIPETLTPKCLIVTASSESNSAKKDVYYDCAPILAISDVGASPGGTASVTYSVVGNTHGYTSFSFDIPYDGSIYTPLTVTPLAALNDPSKGNIFAVNPSFGGNNIRIAFAGGENIGGDGLIFTVNYKVDAAATINELILDAKVMSGAANPLAGKIFNMGFQVDPGLMLIGKIGDIDGDGEITVEDAILLLQMYVGLVPWTPRALLFGDLNGDKEINPVDAALILRLVVG
jgi:hypothetical protein